MVLLIWPLKLNSLPIFILSYYTNFFSLTIYFFKDNDNSRFYLEDVFSICFIILKLKWKRIIILARSRSMAEIIQILTRVKVLIYDHRL